MSSQPSWFAFAVVGMIGLLVFFQRRAHILRRQANFLAERRAMFRYLNSLED